ncbi:MAG: hypothetical protein KGN76_11065 [Acidobacteriota bacterium]|nr:hypothetical protein [Acidobacteriota bacterium]
MPTTPGRIRSAHWGLGLVFSACLTLVVCFVSVSLHGRFMHHAETVRQQFEILYGQPLTFDGVTGPFPERAGRLLAPLLLRAVWAIGGGSAGRAFIAVRLLTAFVAFLAFWGAASALAGDWRAVVLGSVLLGNMLILSFNLPWEVPSDFPDVAFTCGFVWAALQRRRWLLVALVLWASTNRESAAFGAVVWWCLYGVRDDWTLDLRETAYAGLLAAASYAFALGLRWLQIGWTTSFQVVALANDWRETLGFLRHPSPFGWPGLLGAALLPPLAWAFMNIRHAGFEERRLLVAAALIAGITVLFGYITEPRVFLPAGTVLILACVAMERRVPVPAA